MCHTREDGHPLLDLPRKWVVVGARDPHIKGYVFSTLIIKGMFPKRIVGLKFCHDFFLAKYWNFVVNTQIVCLVMMTSLIVTSPN